MVLDNDTRGWIMTGVSGIACVAGASIICVDLLVQLIPRYRSFRIQDSNTFLSSSLSLSFGVMLFSALYSMLPSAKSYLVKGGLQPRPAAFVLIACFLAGVIGISIFSNILHRFIPSHVVGCDHTHEGLEDNDLVFTHSHEHEEGHPVANGFADATASEDTPLLPHQGHDCKPVEEEHRANITAEAAPTSRISPHENAIVRHPSLQKRLTRQLSILVGAAKSRCDEGGPCHGFTDPCGQECFKAISRSPTRVTTKQSVTIHPRSSTFLRRSTDMRLSLVDEERAASDHSNTEISNHGRDGWRTSPQSVDRNQFISQEYRDNSPSGHRCSSGASTPNKIHHHHVASNAFLSIGLQTSIAIALHKLPEGFITYATNHANPKLGFAVFMALFIHNITEGFAMALPLYLAIDNRLKAMMASAVLGGISQPLGAGIAALWLQTAKRHDLIPGEEVYGGMFAVTSGIMTTVALQLFSESLALTHSKNLCIVFAFIGMGVLGVSNALTA